MTLLALPSDLLWQNDDDDGCPYAHVGAVKITLMPARENGYFIRLVCEDFSEFDGYYYVLVSFSASGESETEAAEDFRRTLKEIKLMYSERTSELQNTLDKLEALET